MSSSYPDPKSVQQLSNVVNLSTSLKLISQLLRLLRECTDIASQLVNSPTEGTLPDAPPGSPASSSSSLPSTPPPLSTPSMLTDDEPDAPPAPVTEDTPHLSPEPSPPQCVVCPKTTRQVYACVRRAAENNFSPNGPLSLFVPGKLTLDGRLQAMYNDFLYDLPFEEDTGRLYVITHGRRVGIFASWARAAPHVANISNAVCIKVSSILEGEQILHDCIDQGEARWVKH